MCDTLLAQKGTTAGAVTLFAKNSDRQRNEAQAIDYIAARDHLSGEQVACTYVTIPQVGHTHAVLLSRPYWTWGAEMGANEHGVIIGNEGLHARSMAFQTPALTGMDLVRLSLERSRTAADALNVITSLLEQFGQGGNCGHIDNNFYQNGFLIADRNEAWVLETVGREWLQEHVTGVRSLSNVYSIATPDAMSDRLAETVKGFSGGGDVSHGYADCIGDPNREHIGNAGARRARSTGLLGSHEGRLTTAHMMRFLRDHGPASRSAAWEPRTAPQITICMHAGAVDRPGQTTASWVSELHDHEAVHWVTGTAAPCLSIFKPVLLDVPLPVTGPWPSQHYDTRTFWWRHERLHRTAILTGFNYFLTEVAAQRDQLEASFRTRISAALNGGSAVDRVRVVAACWEEATAAEDAWVGELTDNIEATDAPYDRAWVTMSESAGINLSSRVK